ncbi:MAG: tetratricopeptide repeat protein [Leptolyngbyaceae cyanobacterium CSU_1_3]|nr:tetratricopeptide repeat protein [Leptolyngbyaceae cyanobacterium CSU_1_3]
MPETSSSDRYLELIAQIVQLTLKGNIRSKEQVYQMLVQELEPGTEEVFETCLRDRLSQTQQEADDPSNEAKQARATRSLRALQTIRGEWDRWQAKNQSRSAIITALHQLAQADPAQRTLIFLKVTDPNHPQGLKPDQLEQLAATLSQQPISDPDTQTELLQLAEGITRGLASWRTLQPYLVTWMYDPDQLGFESASEQSNPWATWARQAIGAVPKSLFQALYEQRSVNDWAAAQEMSLTSWVELAIVLQSLQQALISWAENLVYGSKVSSKVAITLFLTFGIVWSQLANGLQRSTVLNSLNRERYTEGAFRVTLQWLRVFAQRDYFPLYGTVFTSFTGGYFRNAMNYLSEPLKRSEGTQEKARILTLLGSSQRVRGPLDLAKEMHEVAREIAQEAGDRPCEIANLNHLSRICVLEKNYAEAISYSQRALIFSRQCGDRLGESNALVNLGYSEVFQAQQLESDPAVYERAIGYLEQGLEIAELLNDAQSKALGYTSLGSAYVMLHQAEQSLQFLEKGVKASAYTGDLYIQSINLTQLTEAFYQMKQFDKAIVSGSLAMYHLEQLGSSDWRQPAGLLTVLQGQMGETFYQQLEAQKSGIIEVIGVDGYDHIPKLIEQYRKS